MAVNHSGVMLDSYGHVRRFGKKGENTNPFQPLKTHMEAKNEGLENHVPFKRVRFQVARKLSGQ